ncbi:MAG: helix-turn-helix domain-containing protein [Phycicoccus sp.]|nr:helix-turn-helix domain-containing protein [Phycicoccus sp.]
MNASTEFEKVRLSGETRARLFQKLTLSVEETRQLLGIGRTAAYEAVRSGEIPSVRVGGRVLVPVASLLRLLGSTE